METAEQRQALQHIAHGIQRCHQCRLHQHRLHAVPGEGEMVQPHALLIGEAPGRREDEEGRPFVGRAGHFLDTLLEQAGCTRQGVYMTNSVKCRPPQNRPPRADELQICQAHWLDRQIALIDPRIIVLLGRTPTRQVLGEYRKMGAVHGNVRQHDGRTFLITYHPAAALRSPTSRQRIRKDFQVLKRLLASKKAAGG